MPQPYPKEFRDDVIRVALGRDKDTTLAQTAKDFGIHEGTIAKWLRRADIDAGNKPGKTTDESAELRELRRRARLLGQEILTVDWRPPKVYRSQGPTQPSHQGAS